MYICVPVHNGFMVEVYTFYVTLHTPLLHVHSLRQKWQQARTRGPFTKTVNLLYDRENIRKTTGDLYASSFVLVSDTLLVTAMSMSWRQH